MTPDLLILSATLFEVSHFLDHCPGQSKQLTKTGLSIVSGKIQNKTYDLIITGPGVFNSAHALTVYLENTSPAMIVQIGIAGVFKQTGLVIGDAAIATREQYIHTGIRTAGLKNTPLPFDLIKADLPSREGIYPFDRNRVDHTLKNLSGNPQITKINVVKGPFITVSAVTSSFQQADKLYAAFSPVMEAMEGAASAHIAMLYDIPMIEIRSASNFVGERDKSNWDIELAVKRLGEVSACL